jgi:SH3 domain protein
MDQIQSLVKDSAMSEKCERIMKKHDKLRVLRKTVLFFGLTAFLCGWFFSAKSWAKSLYVSDTTLEAIIRSGPDVTYSIIASLPIGTRITMIKVERGWAELTLPDGRTGWTLERYISKNPPWRFTAEKLVKEKELLESQIGETEFSSRKLREEKDRMEKELASLHQDLESTSNNFEALKMGAKNYLGLQEAHEKLSTELPKLRKELEEVQRIYDELQSSAKMRWFLYGAGVMVFGWFLGLITGGRRRRRSSEVYR